MGKYETWAVVKGDAILGRIVHYQQGWRFLSNSSARGNGRKHHPTPNAAIPKWAFDMSDDFMPISEFKSKLKAY